MSAALAVRCGLLLGLMATSALLAAVIRLGSCGPLDTLGWSHVLGAACSVLAMVGLGGASWLRPALLGALALVVARGLMSAGRQLHSTRRLRLALTPDAPATLSPALESVVRALAPHQPVEVVADPRPLAFTHGLLRPRVCLSTGAIAQLAPDELAAVLAHERVHVQRYDPLRGLLSRTLAASIFFVPVLNDLHRHFLVQREIEADERAVQVAGPPVLASALLKFLPAAHQPAHLPALMSDSGVAEQRIDALVGHGAPRFRPSAIHLTVSTGAGLVLLCLLLF